MASISHEASWASEATEREPPAKSEGGPSTPTAIFEFGTHSTGSTAGDSLLEKASRSSEAPPSVDASRRPLEVAPASLAEEIPHVDVDFLVQRLTTSDLPLTGQVIAYCWDQAALLSTQRRVLPTQLTVALWPATSACLATLDGESLMEMLQAWKVLLDQNRHFQLSQRVTEQVFQGPLPAAVKRMRDEQLAQASKLMRALAEQGRAFDPDAALSGPSPRDIMLPAFAVIAAEAAWRDISPGRWFMPQVRTAVVDAAVAWNWKGVRGRDTQGMLALKAATSAALRLLDRRAAALPEVYR